MILTQLFANGIIAGAIYALIAASFSLIFNIVKFMDLSPGAIFVVGAFAMYSFNVLLGINVFVPVLLALVVAAIIGLVINFVIYRPLRARKADTFTLLLSSFGVFLFITGFVLLFFGAETHSLGLDVAKGQEILGAVITKTQLLLIACSVILFVLLQMFTRYTRIGKAMRAVADDKVVASTLGINAERTIAITFIASSLLAGIAGILVGFEQNLEHSMGFAAILKGITASIIGGAGNVPAALLGGFLIGIVENLGIWVLPSGYKDAIAFILLIVFLLFRPQGIFGVKTREEVSG